MIAGEYPARASRSRSVRDPIHVLEAAKAGSHIATLPYQVFQKLTRIHTLVTSWNMSLPQAARFVGQTTPSSIFADFLDRMAHALETGQQLDDFLRSEQSVVMKEYATLYESSIYQVEQWKDLYTSVLMSAVFFVVFAIITPLIMNVSPNSLMIAILVIFALLELLLLVVLRFRVPNDHLLNRLKIASSERTTLRRVLAGTTALSVILFAALFFTPLPLGLTLALAASPLAATGFLGQQIENRVKRREDNYGAFVRTLGSSIAARGGSTREVLKKMRQHNFGPLSAMVQNLYARLTWRLNDLLAWKHFSAESGSNLVDHFDDMFVEGLRAGGKPEAIGTIISDNVVRVLNLRKSRYATAATFRGLVTGMTAATAFVLFSGVAVLKVLGDLFKGVETPSAALSPITVNLSMDLTTLQNLLILILFIHCFLVALMLKIVDGGSFPSGFLLFVSLFWMTVLIGYGNIQLMDLVFGATAGP